MQSMQRQFGKLRHKGAGDNAKVAMLLSDYEDADRVLAKVQKKHIREPPTTMVKMSMRSKLTTSLLIHIDHRTG